ncbi:hypothetical protein I3843_08G010000 [Carya illinoinensis]|uniref:ER membrane protein complex subunit 7 beta-sandwich domain-containing protein n=1 Tax=Carya illinoinensis TaxID=32201 RepID=A0A922E7E4_CARIL|nr:hypothetical protein I3760_08G009600 [Carya illinoinensis]KAG6698218.1 hypothetical protein I3842_08G009700 [Carya illinoinensis]KAG7965613.1 hypothetical protein I3843_08G010000 [Carya illinoinensis]
MRSTPVILLLLLHSLLCFSSLSLSHAISAGDGYTINGRVKLRSMGAQGFGLPGKLSNVKVILNGGQRVTFLRPDGYFSFHNVPAGTHLIEVDAIGYFFSPVRVDVSARNPGKVQATLTENRRGLNELGFPLWRTCYLVVLPGVKRISLKNCEPRAPSLFQG